MFRIHRSLSLVLMVLVAALISAPAFAQGTSNSSISGIVVDSGGGVIPGATVTATNDATAGTSTAVSAANGTFTIPGLIAGKYTVNVALQGFKTAVLKDVTVTAGAPATVRAIARSRRHQRDRRRRRRDRGHPDAVVGRRRDDRHQPDRQPAGRRAATRSTS